MTVRWPSRMGVLAYAGLVLAVIVGLAAGVVPRWSGAVHLVALPPLDLAADLRWLVARGTTWPAVVAAASLLLAVRVAILAVLLDSRRPRWRLAATFYAVAWLPLVLAAQLDFIAHAGLYSRLFGAALILLGGVVLFLAATPWTPAPEVPGRFGTSWRAAARAGLHAPALAAYVVALLALGAAAEATRPYGLFVAVLASGALTIVTAAVLRGSAPRRPVLGLASVALVAGVAFAATVLTREAPWTRSDSQREGSAVIMSGINSQSGEGAIFELEPRVVGYTCDQFAYFSYAGPGDGQPRGVAACPIEQGAPYVPDDTQRPFAEQVDLLAEQANELEPPIVVFAHSQAAWVAWQAAADERIDGLSALVLLGPFPTSPLAWPPPGETGEGLVGGELFRLLAPLAVLADFDFMVDAPLSRELLATPDAASDIYAEPLPEDVEALAVTASSDLALMHDGWQINGAIDVCPVREAHPYLPITPHFHRAADRFLDGAALVDPPAVGPGQRGCPPWPELYRLLSQPLGAPPAGL